MTRYLRPALCLALFLASCAETPKTTAPTFTPISFGDLPGWNDDRQSEALPGFSRSCAVLTKQGDGKKYDWRAACAALAQVPPGDETAARAFFTHYLRPYAVNDGEDGLFTGYYEAELRGSLTQTEHYSIPLYTRPADLIGVDLGLFKPEWKGQRIAGKVSDAKLIPYDERAAIAKNSLRDRARVLLWVGDPVDAFFLEIQGSGRVQLADGRIMRIGYDSANGRAYVAIGRALADMGELQKPVTMQGIRAWLAAHSARAQEIMNLNPSYVFFRGIEGEGPIGAQGAALTPQRSLAVDPGAIPLGAPMWLDTATANGTVIRRLVVAQDTGGAIKGPVRGDLFWGAGKEAEAQAGAMQSRGRYFILLPKNAADAED